MEDAIPDDVRRFVLTSIPTVPHIETLLLLWREPRREWLVEDIASRLYVTPAVARDVADDLCAAELVQCIGEPLRFRAFEEPPEPLAALIAAVDRTYARRLREVTTLIHSNIDRKAARFAQAFSWTKRR